MSIDPLTEDYLPINPYAYALNRPNKFIDPDGMTVINGDELERNKQKKIRDARKKALERLKEDYGRLSRRNLKKQGLNKKQIKNIKNLKKQYRKARSAYNYHAGQVSQSQEKIDNLKSASPNLFTKIDNLEVDAIVFTESGMIDSGKRGLTEFATDASGKKTASIYSLNSLVIRLDNKAENEVLRHEFGHFEYQALNTEAYRNYLDELKKKGLSIQGGHRPDDKSGQLAVRYELMKDIEK